MIEILRENGLRAVVAGESFTIDGRTFPRGSTVFFAAQPYRAFLVEMMERQRYPEVREGPDTKEIFKPYDVTAWTLPLMMGVDWARVDRPFQVLEAKASAGSVLLTDGDQVLPASSNASYRIVNRMERAATSVQETSSFPRRSPTSSGRFPSRCTWTFVRNRAAAAMLARISRSRASASTSRGARSPTKDGRASCSTSTSSSIRRSTTPPSSRRASAAAST